MGNKERVWSSNRICVNNSVIYEILNFTEILRFLLYIYYKNRNFFCILLINEANWMNELA